MIRHLYGSESMADVLKATHTKENRKHSIDVSGKIYFPIRHTVLAEVINATYSNKPPQVSERCQAASFLSSI